MLILEVSVFFWVFEVMFNVVKVLIVFWFLKGGVGFDGWLEYIFVIGYLVFGNLRKFGFFCYILFMWMCFGCLFFVS